MVTLADGKLHFWAVLKSSLRDSWPVLNAQKIPYIVLALCVIGVASWLTFFASDPTHKTSPAGLAVVFAWNLAGIVGQPFAIAAALRTWNPTFKMTPTKLVLGFLIFLGSSLAASVALYALVWPGIWLGTKLSLSYTAYQMGIERPYKSSWNLTTGTFWQTLGILAVVIVVGFVVIFVVVMSATVASAGIPALSLVCAPLVMLTYLWLFGFVQLVFVRWTNELREFKTSALASTT
jgi:hypothetical protein